MKFKLKSEHLDCLCGGMTETKMMPLRYHRAGVEYHLEDIPTEVCPRCGEMYYHGPVLLELDRQLDELAASRSAA